MKPRHLLVDLDGTFLASRKWALQTAFIGRSLRHIRGSTGLSRWKAFQLLHEMRKAMEFAGPSDLSNEIRAAKTFAERLGKSDAEALTFLREMIDAVFPTLQEYFSPMREGVSFVEWAHGRFPMTLATNPVWPRHIVVMRLTWAGVTEDRFGLITNAQMMHACKPNVRYYEELLGILGLRAADTLMIGDSEKKDLPARHCGIPVFLLKSSPGLKKYGDGVWRGDFAGLRKILERGEL